MSSSGQGGGDIFDVKRIGRLVELMNKHDLSEIDLRQADQRIRLKKGHDPVYTVAGGARIEHAGPAPTPLPSGTAPAAGSAAPPTRGDDSNLLVIKSPMVGSFYLAPSPDDPPFVKVGDPVGPDTTVCTIEAMKVFNEIPAECSGTVVAVLAENGQSVEYGQPLFRVDPRK